jgi:hypothetical protein
MDPDVKWFLVMVLCVLLIWLAPGCTSGRTATSEIVHGPTLVATSQPVDISQDVSAVKAETQVVADVQAKIVGREGAVTYEYDVWAGRLALVLGFVAFIYAHRNSYKRGRDRRLAEEFKRRSREF